MSTKIRELWYHYALKRPTPEEIEAETRRRANEIAKADYAAFMRFVREGGWHCVIDTHLDAHLAGEAWFIRFEWDGPMRLRLADMGLEFNIAGLYWRA